MLFKLIERIRKEPLAVRRQVVFLVAVVFTMLVTVVWAIGFVVGVSSRATVPAAPDSGVPYSAPISNEKVLQ